MSDKKIRLKENYSESQYCIFFSLEQLLDTNLTDNQNISAIADLLHSVNSGKITEGMVILEYQNEEQAQEQLLKLYRNEFLRENIYAELWENGKFIDKNT